MKQGPFILIFEAAVENDHGFRWEISGQNIITKKWNIICRIYILARVHARDKIGSIIARFASRELKIKTIKEKFDSPDFCEDPGALNWSK